MIYIDDHDNEQEAEMNGKDVAPAMIVITIKR